MKKDTRIRNESGHGIGGPPSGWDLKILHDGACPRCSREIAALRRLDRRRRLAFEDIAAARFDPDPYDLEQR